MKILFLDLDGVVNTAIDFSSKNRDSEHTDKWGHDLSLIRSELVALVDEVCRRTGAKIVFSTSWRYGNTPAYLHRLLVEKGFTGEHAGETPHPETLEQAYQGRGDEVHAYLNQHPEVETFAIVDDMGEDAFPLLVHRFVQTSLATGITREHVERLVEVLGDQNHFVLTFGRHATGPNLESNEPLVAESFRTLDDLVERVRNLPSGYGWRAEEELGIEWNPVYCIMMPRDIRDLTREVRKKLNKV